MLEIRDFRRRPVARENDLFVTVEEGVEGVKEFLLRTLFAAEEMNVVDEEEISATTARPWISRAFPSVASHCNGRLHSVRVCRRTPSPHALGQ